jgi:hypothetical protein
VLAIFYVVVSSTDPQIFSSMSRIASYSRGNTRARPSFSQVRAPPIRHRYARARSDCGSRRMPSHPGC